MQRITLLILSLGMRAGTIGRLNTNHNGVPPDRQSQLEHFRKLTESSSSTFTAFPKSLLSTFTTFGRSSPSTFMIVAKSSSSTFSTSRRYESVRFETGKELVRTFELVRISLKRCPFLGGHYPKSFACEQIVSNQETGGIVSVLWTDPSPVGIL
jgi:hypothetical protein